MLAGWLGLGLAGAGAAPAAAAVVVETVGLGSPGADFFGRLEPAVDGVVGTCPAAGSTT